jgi:hypothetical protein
MIAGSFAFNEAVILSRADGEGPLKRRQSLLAIGERYLQL